VPGDAVRPLLLTFLAPVLYDLENSFFDLLENPGLGGQRGPFRDLDTNELFCLDLIEGFPSRLDFDGPILVALTGPDLIEFSPFPFRDEEGPPIDPFWPL